MPLRRARGARAGSAATGATRGRAGSNATNTESAATGGTSGTGSNGRRGRGGRPRGSGKSGRVTRGNATGRGATGRAAAGHGATGQKGTRRAMTPPEELTKGPDVSYSDPGLTDLQRAMLAPARPNLQALRGRRRNGMFAEFLSMPTVVEEGSGVGAAPAVLRTGRWPGLGKILAAQHPQPRLMRGSRRARGSSRASRGRRGGHAGAGADGSESVAEEIDPSFFSKLTREARNMVWELCVVRRGIVWISDSKGREQPTLAMVSRPIRAEVLPIFYRENKFGFKIPRDHPTNRPHDTLFMFEGGMDAREYSIPDFKNWAANREQKWLGFIRAWIFEDSVLKESSAEPDSFLVCVFSAEAEAEEKGADPQPTMGLEQTEFGLDIDFNDPETQRLYDLLDNSVSANDGNDVGFIQDFQDTPQIGLQDIPQMQMALQDTPQIARQDTPQIARQDTPQMALQDTPQHSTDATKVADPPTNGVADLNTDSASAMQIDVARVDTGKIADIDTNLGGSGNVAEDGAGTDVLANAGENLQVDLIATSTQDQALENAANAETVSNDGQGEGAHEDHGPANRVSLDFSAQIAAKPLAAVRVQVHRGASCMLAAMACSTACFKGTESAELSKIQRRIEQMIHEKRHFWFEVLGEMLRSIKKRNTEFIKACCVPEELPFTASTASGGEGTIANSETTSGEESLTK